MRKPRDYDAELQALTDRAKQLRERRLIQLGELVIACRADTLPIEELAGALLQTTVERDAETRARWRARGEAFFRGKPNQSARGNARDAKSGAPNNGGAQSSAAGKSAA
jgi:hypothetical protein